MDKATVLVKKPYDVRAQLRELGLTPEILEDAVLAWDSAAASATPFEPVTASGSKGWFAGIGTLREILVGRHGWKALDMKCWPIVMAPHGKHAISMTSGDAMTGRIGLQSPRTKNPKGFVVQAAIHRNGVQLDFGEAITREEQLSRVRSIRVEWFSCLSYLLLVHRGSMAVQSELSLPYEISAGKVVGWDKRIILADIPRHPTPLRLERDDDDEEEDGTIDVPVVRR